MGFAAIIGQEQEIQIMQNAIREGRIAHAYLFVGGPGSGKKTLARAFASALNCLASPGATPPDGCGVCGSCRKIAGGLHPDVRMVSPEGNALKIEQMRLLQREISYKPYEGEYKVFIIDHAETMTPEAANSLLKVLEDPPEHSVIILLAPSPHAILPTLVSRCLPVRLRLLPTESVARALVERGVDPALANDVAPAALGSLGRGIVLSEGAFAGLQEEAVELIRGMSGHSAAEMIARAASLEKRREEIGLFLEILLSFYRDLLLLGSGKPGSGREERGERLLANQSRLDWLGREAAGYSRESLLFALGAIARTRELLPRNVNVRLALEVLLLQLKNCRRGGSLFSIYAHEEKWHV
ncbi:MAG: DNA polymerase III subunit delta' [Firmicutes bacterium]|nr:DNA polymerase III subunit delta' [Bacillota bacterium]